MELALSLGDTTPKPFSSSAATAYSSDPPLVQLDLLPFTPVQRSHPRLNQPCGPARAEANLFPVTVTSAEDVGDDGASLSSPNSAVSPFQVDFSIRSGNADYGGRSKREQECGGAERASDDDENAASNRKKLRLTKEQSAFLEESFKEHATLTPKQKLALAKQLNLRPRQVEVWFQNRRARTKLKQTEVDCEYLKRCCETLTEENRRLQKELQELRALKTCQPFYMQQQLPATTLTMCPSCERVATNSTTTTTTNSFHNPAVELSLSKPTILPFRNAQAQAQKAQAQKPAS